MSLTESLAPSGALDLCGQERGWGRVSWDPPGLMFLDVLTLPGTDLSRRQSLSWLRVVSSASTG